MASRAQAIGRAGLGEAIRHNLQLPQEQGPEAPSTSVLGLAQVLRREVPAEWVGRGAALAGLPAEASEASIREVFEHGRVPAEGGAIFRESSSNRAIGAVITAPKTVSALLADERTAEAAKASMGAARDEYVRTLETFVRSRSGAQGVNSEAIEGLTAASFEHYSSSSGDPHLHCHLLIANSAQCADGKWRALDGKTLFAGKRIAEAAAMKAMKESLKESLGLPESAFEEHQVGSVRGFELTRLKATIEPLSNAKRHMSETLAEMGRTLGGQSWAEDLTAWRKHRTSLGDLAERIEHEVDANLVHGGEGADRLREMWNDRTDGALRRGIDNLRRPVPVDMNLLRPTLEQRAYGFVSDQHSWGHADLAAWLVPDCASAEEASVRAAEFIEDWHRRDMVALPEGTHVLESSIAVVERAPCPTQQLHAAVGLHAKFISAAGLRREQKLNNDASQLARREGLALDVQADERWSAEQRQAVGVISEGRRLSVITGVAGAGKTTIAAPCAAAAKEQGMTVVSIARNAQRAADTGEGIQADHSMSVAAFLKKGVDKVGSRKPVLLVVDEAAVIDRKDWESILQVAERGNVQVVAFGDRKQAQSIDRQGGFAIVEHAARSAGSASLLTKSYRNQAWEEEANAIRCGDSKGVVNMAEGRISQVTAADFASDVAARVATEPGSIAITMTNAEAAAISRQVQAGRGIQADFAISQDSYAGVGDRIRTRKNDHKAGLLNGDRWTVEQVGEVGLVVRNDAGRQVFIGQEYASQSVELDYAATLDSAQGITVPKAIVVAREGMGVSQLYSAATRGRQAPEYVVVGDGDPAAVLDGIVQKDDLARTSIEIAGENRARQVLESTGEFQGWDNFFEAAEREDMPEPAQYATQLSGDDERTLMEQLANESAAYYEEDAAHAAWAASPRGQSPAAAARPSEPEPESMSFRM